MTSTKLKTIAITAAIIICIAGILFGCSYIPLSAATLDKAMKKTINETITSITVLTEPCCGPMEGARNTTYIDDAAILNKIIEIIANTKMQRQTTSSMPSGGRRIKCTIETRDKGTYQFTLSSLILQKSISNYRILNYQDWNYITETRPNTIVETEW